MRRFLTAMSLMALALASCSPVRIVTVSPDYASRTHYTTTVTVPRNHTVTTIRSVNTYDDDISLHLDLEAVAAAFAQSSSIQAFENMINDSRYMISNLDLNRDGYIDYLRVMETMEGWNHVYVIQAVLDHNIYQDVATLVAEVPSYGNYTVQIIGSPYIYGPDYIIQPVFITRPAIFGHICARGYRPWSSPWHWGYYPSCYRRPAPVYLSHYQSYVHTYMNGHRYCHEFTYVTHVHYHNYVNLSRPICRNDYGMKYPERSFTVRTADSPSRATSATERAFNARDIRAAQSRTQTRTQESTRSSSTTRQPATATTRQPATSGTRQSATSPSSTTRQPSAAPSTTTRQSSSTTSRQPASSTTTSGSSSSTRRSSTTTTVETTVKSSGKSETTRSSSSSTRSSSSSTRSSSSSSSSTRSSSSSSSTRSSSSSSSSSRSGSSSSSSSSRSSGGRR